MNQKNQTVSDALSRLEGYLNSCDLSQRETLLLKSVLETVYKKGYEQACSNHFLHVNSARFTLSELETISKWGLAFQRDRRLNMRSEDFALMHRIDKHIISWNLPLTM